MDKPRFCHEPPPSSFEYAGLLGEGSTPVPLPPPRGNGLLRELFAGLAVTPREAREKIARPIERRPDARKPFENGIAKDPNNGQAAHLKPSMVGDRPIMYKEKTYLASKQAESVQSHFPT